MSVETLTAAGGLRASASCHLCVFLGSIMPTPEP